MDLNIEQMKELIDLFEGTDLSEISVQQDDFQVTLKKNSAGEPELRSRKNVTQSVTGQKRGEETPIKEQKKMKSGAEGATKEKTNNESALTSPIVGTFYRSPSPEESPYVDVGDRVEKGDTVCIVEAMKVMNEVKADQSGKVTDICVEDGDSVEYGETLFKLASPNEGS